MNIRVYSKKNCAGCDQVKALLDTKGLGYEAVDVMLSKDAQALFRERGFRSVPQIMIDGEFVTIEQLKDKLDSNQ